MRRDKILLVVEYLPRAGNGTRRPVVTAVKPVPWWMRVWQTFAKHGETVHTDNAVQAEHSTYSAVYAIEAHPRALKVLAGKCELKKGVRLPADGAHLDLAITTNEEAVMSAHRAMHHKDETIV